MTDPTALVAAGAQPAGVSGPAAPQQSAAPSRLDPGETRMFANMMQGVQAPPSAVAAPSALGDAAKALASQLSGNVRSYEEMRRSMLESIDMSDPIKTMFAMTDHAMEAHMMFAKMHISTGLASAATSLFGTLLKNQQ
ncbi:hypothetical protein ABL840_28765 [Variovorax sp. NFACC27]|jgi:hypothetical protein|uniref:hypothetical protein n=1 Tax=unclassified Variovorax TaxID=663243 RepID=UPI000895E909|nr:hypothetical protein [Variovorax paradoxus]SEF30571.1 hypothetical protein SAMN03159371_04886 [Variovorax sp. NFACC28]SEG87452.1 hypothetical protein SAMN03159365_04887 [Variovorax sp. NFACC29]SFD28721.1 hypothetical protein SAMN03159379_04777 [Variovorax sp. NFACC26]SFG33660.1 hypothetical protein SAMN03159447_02886 [Variovorax sp. NFACC27]